MARDLRSPGSRPTGHAPTDREASPVDPSRGREQVGLGEGVTAEKVFEVAGMSIDLAYQQNGENAYVRLLAVEADWLLQQAIAAQEALLAYDTACLATGGTEGCERFIVAPILKARPDYIIAAMGGNRGVKQ